MMCAKRNVISVLGWLLLAAAAGAQETYFSWSGTRDSSWDDPASWSKRSAFQGATTDVSNGALIPGSNDQVRVSSPELRITNNVAIGYFKGGISSRAEVTIDGGTLTTTGSADYNSVGFKMPFSLTIKNGGSATFYNYLMVGFKASQGGIVQIYDGTLRVSNTYFHNKEYNETANLDTKTAIYAGGRLDVDQLMLNAGVLDIAGGTIVIRRAISIQEIRNWIEQGRIIAMGGEEGWTVHVEEDPSTSWITLTAEPSLVVGSSKKRIQNPA